MPRKDVVDYIDQRLKRGHHVNKVKAELISFGHKLGDVEQAIAHIYQRKAVLKIFLAALFLFLIVIGVFYFKGMDLTKGKVAVEGEAEEIVLGEAEVLSEELDEEQVEGFDEVGEELTCEEKCKGDGICLILCENLDVVNRAVNENDLGFCEQLSLDAKVICEDLVYLNKAVLENNVGLCRNIVDESVIEECLGIDSV